MTPSSPVPPPQPTLWPSPDGREQLSTELHVELGGAAHPVLVRVTSRRLDPRTGIFGTSHGYIAITSAGVVLIDPHEPTPDVRDAFDALAAPGGASPLATVLTSSWHERGAYLLRDRLGSPVWLPRAGIAEKEGEPDHLYGPASTLPGGLRAIPIDDRFAGDTVLSWETPDGTRVLFGGDALIGGSEVPGHWRCEPGLHLWMFGALDESRFRAAFSPLLEEPFDLAFSAHGAPVPFRDNPRQALAALLERGVFSTSSPLGTGLSLPPT